MSTPLSILLIDGGFERAHYALVLSTGAAAMGREVTLFATNGGLHALCRNWSALSGAELDGTLRARGVAGFDALREAAVSLGVAFQACEAGLAAWQIPPDALLEGVQRVGVATFLGGATGQVLSI